MLVGVWVITATMIGLQWRAGHPGTKTRCASRGHARAGHAPDAGAVSAVPARARTAVGFAARCVFAASPGLSDSMSPGTLSQLSLSDAVAFGCNSSRRSRKPNQLYWRGPVLWYFDGASWHMGIVFDSASSSPSYSPGGAAFSYTVTLEPHDKRWLFALDLPAKAGPGQPHHLPTIRSGRSPGAPARALRDDFAHQLPAGIRRTDAARAAARVAAARGLQLARPRPCAEHAPGRARPIGTCAARCSACFATSSSSTR